ncbi:hypothetical protein L21SP3_02043 [Sedimentisphaera cyanobacteriorum]|uniref:Cell division protein FtsQ n=1 Tax=Sedimentisphaera cyanobacteriorum TaxID=1940790 RepID=A0A1Q2HSK0_9BACT|nr:hypothetical protein [Sedimentisphaera cyanobacteriorum]AQQ10215.1 hypothetical protein L21SP3_02043 [Sedimentisphaera cyanobacteriorum]
MAGKTKRTASKNKSPKKSARRSYWRALFRLPGLILIIGAVYASVWGILNAENHIKQEIIRESEREISMVLRGYPNWINASLKRRIVEQGYIGLEKLTASPGTAKLVAKNLKSKFPWLKNVRVQTSINRLTIDADYRKPAVLLRHKSAKYYISEDMTVLDYIPIDSLSVPEVSGVVLASAPSPGEPLFHEQIKASVKLTQLFRAMDKSRSRKFLKQVESIDVENYGITDSSIPQIVIKTKEELDIFWGAAPGDAEAYFEMPEKKKLAVLYTIFESHPNLKGRYENIDLRFEQ